MALLLCLWSNTITIHGFVVPNEVRGCHSHHAVSSTERRFSTRGSISMYMPPSSTSQTPPMSAQKILATPGVSPSNKREGRKSSTPLSLSPSVLASCDTLPSFHTAHGLLSPETVMRLDKMTRPEDRSQALNLFLTTYRRDGPMSCLKMLSDPDILPHLTSAMRDLLAWAAYLYSIQTVGTLTDQLETPTSLFIKHNKRPLWRKGRRALVYIYWNYLETLTPSLLTKNSSHATITTNSHTFQQPHHTLHTLSLLDTYVHCNKTFRYF